MKTDEPESSGDEQSESSPKQLKREIQLLGAIALGLGSIIGTGVFVSIGIAAGVAGPGVVLAIVLAGVLATCNGLSSAQLAANHPVSGGTYEYGHRWLSPTTGFAAGWLFLCAKSASAATAALGLAGYAGMVFGFQAKWMMIIVAMLALLLLTLVTLTGIKRSTFVNTVIVLIVLVSLGMFVSSCFSSDGKRIDQFFGTVNYVPAELLEATALMFVAYTGYGRIATLGEEVKNPRKTIPKAMIWTLCITIVLYVTVAVAAIAVVGIEKFVNATNDSGAPLLFVASTLKEPFIKYILFAGAMTAMVGVVLNLLLGLSRVALAMARRADLPRPLADVTPAGVPGRSTLFIAVIIGSLIAIGDIKLSWSFSAFTVLVYYSLTNLCAVMLTPSERLYSVWISWAGLAGCLVLAFSVDPKILLVGVGVLLLGFLFRFVMKSLRSSAE